MINEECKTDCKMCKKNFKERTLNKGGGYCGRCLKKRDKEEVGGTYKKKPIPPKLRQEVWERNIGDRLWGKCFTCNMRLSSFEFAAGHVVSEATGGSTTIDNLKVVCKSCNSKMGIKNMNEFKKIRYSQNMYCQNGDNGSYKGFKVINRKRMMFEL
jgi:hypothetical protein